MVMGRMRGWRRDAPGKGYQALVQRRETLNPAMFRKDFLRMTEAEFVDAMLTERVSARMVEKQLADFRVLKAEDDERRQRLQKVRKDRANREVGEELSWYAKAEAMMRLRKKERHTDDDDEEAL